MLSHAGIPEAMEKDPLMDIFEIVKGVLVMIALM